MCCFSPVFSSFLLEDHVAVVHSVLRGHIDAGVGIVRCCLAQHVVNNALSIFPHVSQGPPHNVNRAVALAEKVLRILQQQRDAGVRDHPQGGPVSHVALEAARGRVIHPPDAGRAVNLCPGGLSQHLTGARHDAAKLAAQPQRLEGRKPDNGQLLGLRKCVCKLRGHVKKKVKFQKPLKAYYIIWPLTDQLKYLPATDCGLLKAKVSLLSTLAVGHRNETRAHIGVFTVNLESAERMKIEEEKVQCQQCVQST